MDPWGTPSLAGYSCEHFPSRTTWSSLLLRKGEIRPNILPDLSLKKTSLPNSVENLGYIKCFSSSSPTSSIRHIFRRSSVDQEDLKPYWKSEKWPHFWIKVCYDLFNLGSYGNIMQFQKISESSRLEFLEKFLVNNFTLSEAEDNTSGLLNRTDIADYSRFTLVKNTTSNSPKVQRAKFLGSDGLFWFSSICKFCSIKNPFAMITSLSEFYFRFRRFILLVQKKKVISLNYASSTSCWKPRRWVRLDLILTIKNIYINSNLNRLTKFTSGSTEFKDILQWNISQRSQRLSKSTRQSSQAMRWNRASSFEFIGKSIETETLTWSEFPNGGKTIVEQTLASEEINKSKRAGLWELQSVILLGKLTIWVRLFEIVEIVWKIITESGRPISSTRIG